MWALRRASANSSLVLPSSSRRTIAPVSRNSKASARLVLPWLLAPQTAAIGDENTSVCGLAPKARKPWISILLIRVAGMRPPQLVQPIRDDALQRGLLGGGGSRNVRANQARGQAARLELLRETLEVRQWRRGVGHDPGLGQNPL